MSTMRRFFRKQRRRDRTGWLGRQDSNLGMAESKSTCSAFDFNDHPGKSANFDSFPSNRLGADSECAARRAQAFWCFLITLAFAVIMFLTAWHGPDCRSPQRSISIGGAVLMAGWGARQEREHGTTHRRAPRQVALHAGGLVRRGTRCLLGVKMSPPTERPTRQVLPRNRPPSRAAVDSALGQNRPSEPFQRH